MWGAAPILFWCARCSGTLVWARPAAATPARSGPAASPPPASRSFSGGGASPRLRGGGGPLLWLPSWGGCRGGGGMGGPPPRPPAPSGVGLPSVAPGVPPRGILVLWGLPGGRGRRARSGRPPTGQCGGGGVGECLLGGGFGRPLWCWRAVWWLWAVLSPPPPCFFWGGVCLFLPLPSLGWRTHWPAFFVVFQVAVGGCVLLGRVPAPWVGWVMYTSGSAPLPAGLGPGPAGWPAAPGGFLWLWVRGLGLSVSFLLRGASFNLLGGPPPLLPGPRCRCVACWCGAFRGVRWLVWVSPSG